IASRVNRGALQGKGCDKAFIRLPVEFQGNFVPGLPRIKGAGEFGLRRRRNYIIEPLPGLFGGPGTALEPVEFQSLSPRRGWNERRRIADFDRSPLFGNVVEEGVELVEVFL